MPKVGKNRWEHIFKWHIDETTNRPSGFHLERSYPGKILPELVLVADEFGVYAGYYEQGNWCKFSTFFPKNWTRIQVKEKLIEVFKNPTIKESNAIIGVTSEGIKIKIVFGKETTSGTTYIKTAFPLYKGESDVMKFIKILGQNKISFKKR